MSSRGRSAGGACALAILSGVLLSGCHVPGFNTVTPADAQGARGADLWRGASFAALAVGCLVWALIVFTVLRYRRTRKTPPDAIPSQRAEITWLEILYTATPLVIVATLFVFTTSAQRQMNAVSSHPDLKVSATAFQWGWQFTYPGGGSVVTSDSGPPTLVLPLGKVVQIDLTATDVVHAFYVPAFLFQRNAVPGSPTTFDVTPTRLGTYDGKCTTFCGIRHYLMTFTVRVVSPDDFRQWMAALPPPGS